MKIYLLDRNLEIVNAWNKYFKDIFNIEIIHNDFKEFMDTHNVDCVVSPANSYGLMDGGYDRAISEYFGWDLMEKVQQYILENYRGEQLVGTSFIISTGLNNIKLIHTPTMRIPSVIKDPEIVYNCMRSCLLTAIENKINQIVIPAFGGSCGKVNPYMISEKMYLAYEQIVNPPIRLDWNYALRNNL